MIKGEIKLRVRYSDTDQMGYVFDFVTTRKNIERLSI